MTAQPNFANREAFGRLKNEGEKNLKRVNGLYTEVRVGG
jgi:hypothetical protein